MTWTAMRPDSGRPNGRQMSLWSERPRVGVDLGLERLVGVVRSEEVGVPDDEALLVVVGVAEPKRDAVDVGG